MTSSPLLSVTKRDVKPPSPMDGVLKGIYCTNRFTLSGSGSTSVLDSGLKVIKRS